MKNLFVRFVREEAGQDLIEYALLAAFISIVAWGLSRHHRHGRQERVHQRECGDDGRGS